MALTYKVLGQSQLSTSLASVYTVPSATQSVVSTLAVSNTANSVANVDVYVNSPQFRGTNWVTRAAWTITSAITGIAYGNGIYVAANDGGIMASTDTITWTTTSQNSVSFYTVAYANGLFLGGRVNVSSVRSTDGINWTVGGPNSVRTFIYGGGKWVSGSAGGTYIWTSTDGISWGPGDTNVSTGVHALAYGNSTYLAAVGASTSANTLMISTNASVWTTSANLSADVNALVFAQGVFVYGGKQLGTNDGTIATSTDGITWTTRVSNLGAEDVISLVYNDGLFLASGDAGTITVSTDAITWTTTAKLSTRPLVLGAGGGAYLAGSDGGTLYSETNLKTALLYNAQVAPNSENSLTIGLTLGAGDQIYAKSNTASAINVNIFGSEIS